MQCFSSVGEENVPANRHLFLFTPAGKPLFYASTCTETSFTRGPQHEESPCDTFQREESEKVLGSSSAILHSCGVLALLFGSAYSTHDAAISRSRWRREGEGDVFMEVGGASNRGAVFPLSAPLKRLYLSSKGGSELLQLEWRVGSGAVVAVQVSIHAATSRFVRSPPCLPCKGGEDESHYSTMDNAGSMLFSEGWLGRIVLHYVNSQFPRLLLPCPRSSYSTSRASGGGCGPASLVSPSAETCRASPSESMSRPHPEDDILRFSHEDAAMLQHVWRAEQHSLFCTSPFCLRVDEDQTTGDGGDRRRSRTSSPTRRESSSFSSSDNNGTSSESRGATSRIPIGSPLEPDGGVGVVLLPRVLREWLSQRLWCAIQRTRQWGTTTPLHAEEGGLLTGMLFVTSSKRRTTRDDGVKDGLSRSCWPPLLLMATAGSVCIPLEISAPSLPRGPRGDAASSRRNPEAHCPYGSPTQGKRSAFTDGLGCFSRADAAVLRYAVQQCLVGPSTTPRDLDAPAGAPSPPQPPAYWVPVLLPHWSPRQCVWVYVRTWCHEEKEVTRNREPVRQDSSSLRMVVVFVSLHPYDFERCEAAARILSSSLRSPYVASENPRAAPPRPWSAGADDRTATITVVEQSRSFEVDAGLGRPVTPSPQLYSWCLWCLWCLWRSLCSWWSTCCRRLWRVGPSHPFSLHSLFALPSDSMKSSTAPDNTLLVLSSDVWLRLFQRHHRGVAPQPPPSQPNRPPHDAPETPQYRGERMVDEDTNHRVIRSSHPHRTARDPRTEPLGTTVWSSLDRDCSPVHEEKAAQPVTCATAAWRTAKRSTSGGLEEEEAEENYSPYALLWEVLQHEALDPWKALGLPTPPPSLATADDENEITRHRRSGGVGPLKQGLAPPSLLTFELHFRVAAEATPSGGERRTGNGASPAGDPSSLVPSTHASPPSVARWKDGRPVSDADAEVGEERLVVVRGETPWRRQRHVSPVKKMTPGSTNSANPQGVGRREETKEEESPIPASTPEAVLLSVGTTPIPPSRTPLTFRSQPLTTTSATAHASTAAVWTRVWDSEKERGSERLCRSSPTGAVVRSSTSRRVALPSPPPFFGRKRKPSRGAHPRSSCSMWSSAPASLLVVEKCPSPFTTAATAVRCTLVFPRSASSLHASSSSGPPAPDLLQEFLEALLDRYTPGSGATTFLYRGPRQRSPRDGGVEPTTAYATGWSVATLVRTDPIPIARLSAVFEAGTNRHEMLTWMVRLLQASLRYYFE